MRIFLLVLLFGFSVSASAEAPGGVFDPKSAKFLEGLWAKVGEGDQPDCSGAAYAERFSLSGETALSIARDQIEPDETDWWESDVYAVGLQRADGTIIYAGGEGDNETGAYKILSRDRIQLWTQEDDLADDRPVRVREGLSVSGPTPVLGRCPSPA